MSSLQELLKKNISEDAMNNNVAYVHNCKAQAKHINEWISIQDYMEEYSMYYNYMWEMKNGLDNKIFNLLSIIKSKYSCITLKKDKEYIDYNLKRFPIFAHGKYGRNKKPIEKYIEEVKILIKIYDSIEFLQRECILFELHSKIDDCYIKMTNFMNQHLERIYVMQLHKKELTDNIQLKPEYRELQIKTYISFYLEENEEEE